MFISRLLLPVVFLLVICGCNCGSTIEVKQTCSSSVACPAGRICVAGQCEKVDAGMLSDAGTTDAGLADAGPVVTLTAFAIEPPTAVLISSNGSKPTQTFGARMTFSDGSS